MGKHLKILFPNGKTNSNKMSEIISINSPEIIEKTKEFIEKGDIVCIPTDTIYGLSVNSFDKNSLIKLKRLKQREEPFLLLTDSLNKIIGLINYINPVFHKLKANGLIPGPLTLLFKVRVNIDDITSERGTIAVRIPKSDFLQKLLSSINFPIVSTSANLKGMTPAKTIEEAHNYLKEDVKLYVDAGKLDGPPSTIIDISDENIRYIREGGIKFKKIKQIIDN